MGQAREVTQGLFVVGGLGFFAPLLETSPTA